MKISNRKRITAALAAPATAMFGHRAFAQDGTSGPAVSDENWPTDSWTTAELAEHGFPADLAAQIDAQVSSTAPLVTGVLVIRNGELVVDNYYNDWTPDDPFHIWSITKSGSSIAT